MLILKEISRLKMLDKKSRILVVGGGIVGCSTAYFLAKAGYTNLAVYEAVGVAHAASGRAGGFLAADWCDTGRHMII